MDAVLSVDPLKLWFAWLFPLNTTEQGYPQKEDTPRPIYIIYMLQHVSINVYIYTYIHTYLGHTVWDPFEKEGGGRGTKSPSWAI